MVNYPAYSKWQFLDFSIVRYWIIILSVHVHLFLTESIGSLLCERVLNVLFDVWILSCARCFPAPSLWKTLQDMCSSWRHHDALIAQWHRVNVAFTTRLLHNIYGTTPRLPAAQSILSSDKHLQHISYVRAAD